MTGREALTLVVLAGAVAGASNAPGKVVGGATWHRVAAGESVVSIAARAGIEPGTLAFDNDIRVDRPLTVGSWLLVDNRHIVPAPPLDGIVVNVPQRMLHLAVDGQHLLSVPVAVGRPDWPTPLGSLAVSIKEVNPTWDVPASIQAEMAREGQTVVIKVPPGPHNPLGDRWIGLSAGLGIHGTNQPTSIYRFTTHGCIRLHPEDIAGLFQLAAVGTPVQVIYEPVLLAELESGEVWIEVHRDPYRRGGDRLRAARDLLQAAGLGDLAVSPLVETIVRAQRGRAERLR